MNNSPAWKTDLNALADSLNVRVFEDEVQTTLGRAKENATAIQSGATIQSMEYGVNSDGTERLIVAADGGYWRVNGDTKTLISKAPQVGEAVAEVSAQIQVDCTATQWTEDIAAGDLFYFTADGVTAATQVSGVASDTQLLLSVNYKGAATSGPYEIWDKQDTTNKAQIVKYMDKWFFANGVDRPMQWEADTDEFREVGFGTAEPITAVSGAAAGSLSADSWYGYKVARESLVGSYRRYGNATSQTALDVGGNGSVSATNFDSFKAFQTHWRIYRTLAQATEAAVSTAQFFHLTSVPVSSVSAASWHDTLADSVITNSLANVSDEAPTQQDQPPISAASVMMHKDRLLWTVGSDLYIGGLPPYDYHSDAKGRYEPEYAPLAQIRYIGRDTRDQVGCQGNFEQGEVAYFLRSRTMYMLRSESDDPTIWQTVVAREDVGSEAFWSVAQDGQFTYWLGRLGGRLGVMRFNGAIVDNLGKPIQGSVDTFTVSTLSAAAAGCSEGYYYLSVNTSGGDKTFELNTDRGNGRMSWSEKDWFAESYCKGTTKGYCGDDSGFVYQLEQGLDDAGSAITRRIATAAVRFRTQDPHSDRYWKIGGRVYAEVYSQNGFSALSGWFKRDEGSWVGISGYPISAAAGATVYKSAFLPDTQNGRGFEFKFESSGTGEDWTFRDLYFDGQVKPDFRADGTET
jgi:hypothetical protein